MGSAAVPGCARPATRARTRPTRRTSRSCSRRSGRQDDRRVAYVCAIALVGRGRLGVPVRGALRGDPGDASRVARGGFGYDPAFVPDDTGPDDERTMAELAPAEKHAISHRGRAARKLAAHLGRRGAGMSAVGPVGIGPDHQAARRGGLDRVELRADRAEAGGGGDHRLGRDPERGAPLDDRPDRLGDRLRLGPPRRRAGGRRPSLRAREAGEPRRLDRGDADPRRRRA